MLKPLVSHFVFLHIPDHEQVAEPLFFYPSLGAATISINTVKCAVPGSVGSKRLSWLCVFCFGVTGGGHFAGGDCDGVAANFTLCASAELNFSLSSLSSQPTTATESAFSPKSSSLHPSLVLAPARGGTGGGG